MSYFLPEGSKLFMSTTIDATKAVTVVTNASPAVATSTAHGYANNDELLFTSGWEDATDTVWRAAGITANTVNLSGLDAADVAWFPAGGGIGTLQKVSAWLELTQWLTVQMQGGDARMVNVEPLGRRNAIALPAGFNPSSLTMSFGHDIALASQQALITASRGLQKRAFKMALAGGSTAYFYGYVSMSEMPQINRGQVLSVQATATVLGRFISY